MEDSRCGVSETSTESFVAVSNQAQPLERISRVPTVKASPKRTPRRFASRACLTSCSPIAGGISEALITTAAGLTVAIPSLMFYRFFRGRVDQLVVTMEQEALKMMEALHASARSARAKA